MLVPEPIDRERVLEIITLLRRHRLFEGHANVFRTRLIIPLAARRGTPPIEVVNAIKAAQPGIELKLLAAIERSIVGGENQRVAIEFLFPTTLIAEYVKRLANQDAPQPPTRRVINRPS